MEGFTNLTSIGGCFLKGSQLTAFSCEGLENVTSIGSFFLKGNQLTAFSCKGLENVISIEGYFLDNNIHLKSVDLTGLKSIHSICHFFLDGCPNIKEIFVTKEKEALFKTFPCSEASNGANSLEGSFLAKPTGEIDGVSPLRFKCIDIDSISF